MADSKTTMACSLHETEPLPLEPSDASSGAYLPRIEGYQILREISRGGQGAVFEALRTSTGRSVAVKVLAGGALSTPREVARFDQEAKILAALDHPGIVQIIDRGQAADGSQYLVMDYLAGQPLSSYLGHQHSRLLNHASDPSEPLRLFLKIADAVNAAHIRGIVHRDLKPANILIDTQGEPHILDFGLARTALMRYTDEPNPEPVTMTGQFLGSLPWSSPEQADGRSDRVDMRSDVYSLGVILYQLLTGTFPYTVEGSMREVLNNILSAQPTPPSKVVEARLAREARRQMKMRTGASRLNPVVDAIVLRALAKRPEDRYQSAGELARDIANYLSGRPTMAMGEVRKPWSKTAWIALGGGVAACLAGAVLIGMRLAGSSDAPVQATQNPALQEADAGTGAGMRAGAGAGAGVQVPGQPRPGMPSAAAPSMPGPSQRPYQGAGPNQGPHGMQLPPEWRPGMPLPPGVTPPGVMPPGGEGMGYPPPPPGGPGEFGPPGAMPQGPGAGVGANAGAGESGRPGPRPQRQGPGGQGQQPSPPAGGPWGPPPR